MISKSLAFVILSLMIAEISGHGFLKDPSSRSTIWRIRTDLNLERNYNDNEVFCGGAYVQNSLNGGLCGVCGDAYSDPHPQDNANTGKFGQGVISGTYESGTVINVTVQLTANHVGSFNYSLCVLEDISAPESEECFKPLLLEDGSSDTLVSRYVNDYIVSIQLPNITCDRCVFRWTYRAGNNWGSCNDGTSRLGCGPQEHFRNCADISILPPTET